MLGRTILCLSALMIVFVQPAAQASNAAAASYVPTSADVAFLAQNCQIDQRDIDVIGKLEPKTQEELRAKIAQRNCELLSSFVAARNYYRRLDIKKPVPLPPEGWYKSGIQYLSKDEYDQYMNIMNNAPW